MKSLADLLLVADESTRDWINVPALRRPWYAFCALALAFAGISIGIGILREVVDQSEATVLFTRVLKISILAFSTIVLIQLTVTYFKFVLEKHAAIRIENVVFFYSMSVILFGLIYASLWLIFPSTFYFPSPPIQHSTKTISGLGLIRLTIDFILFSALTTVGAASYAISTNSVVSALISWVQGIYTLSLIALLIASYVNQKVAPLPERTGEKPQDTPVDQEQSRASRARKKPPQ